MEPTWRPSSAASALHDWLSTLTLFSAPALCFWLTWTGAGFGKAFVVSIIVCALALPLLRLVEIFLEWILESVHRKHPRLFETSASADIRSHFRALATAALCTGIALGVLAGGLVGIIGVTVFTFLPLFVLYVGVTEMAQWGVYQVRIRRA